MVLTIKPEGGALSPQLQKYFLHCSCTDPMTAKNACLLKLLIQLRLRLLKEC